MKKAIRFTMWLALFIVIIFTTGMLMTFVNDAIQNTGFFADTKFVPYKTSYGDTISGDGTIDRGYVWGGRHYWYYWMCICLFILMIIRVAIWAVYYWDEKKDAQCIEP